LELSCILETLERKNFTIRKVKENMILKFRHYDFAINGGVAIKIKENKLKYIN